MRAEIIIRDDFCKHCCSKPIRSFTSDVSPVVLLWSLLWPNALTHILSVRLEVFKHEHMVCLWLNGYICYLHSSSVHPSVPRWTMQKKKRKMWLKASSAMVKLHFWLNIEYVLLFHHRSRSCDQATGQRQSGCLVMPVCVERLQWTIVTLGSLHQDLIFGLLEVQAFITHASQITVIPLVQFLCVEKLQLGANMET